MVLINIGSGRGGLGDAVTVIVSIETSGMNVAATVNEIMFDTDALSLDPSTCRVNPDIGKSLIAGAVGNGTFRFFLQPGDPAPIPDGPLYTCVFRIAPLALPGRYQLAPPLGFNASAFDPSGLQAPHVMDVAGAITVSLVPEVCPGDCNGDGQVNVNELLTMVNIALGDTNLSACTPGDANLDNDITIDEILAGVNSALAGCPAG